MLLVPVPSSRGGAARPRPGPRAGADRCGRWPSCAPPGSPAAGGPAAAPPRPGAGLRRRCRPRSGGPTWPARSCRPRAGCPPGRCWSLVDDVVTSGATLTEAAAVLAGAAARRARPPVLAAVVAATPRTARRRLFRERPGRCPQPDGRTPLDRLSGAAGERTSVEATHTRSTGRSHGDRGPWSQRRSSRALPPARRGQGRSARPVRRQAEDPPHRRGALPREESPPVRRTASASRSRCAARAPSSAPKPPAPDFYAALDRACAKLDDRLRRAADRRRVHHGRRTPASVRMAEQRRRRPRRASTPSTASASSPRVRTSPTSTSTCPGGSSARSTTPPPR